MKISIDTKEDSHEEIRKIIRMLSSLVGQEVISNSQEVIEEVKRDKEEAQNPDLFAMMGEQEKQEEKKKEDTELDIPGLEEYED